MLFIRYYTFQTQSLLTYYHRSWLVPLWDQMLNPWTPISEWYVVRCGSKSRHQKDVFKRYWTTCTKYSYHFGLDSQHGWGDLYDYLMSMRIFTLMTKKIFIWAPKLMRNDYEPDLGLLIILHWLCVSYPTRSGYTEKSINTRLLFSQV